MWLTILFASLLCSAFPASPSLDYYQRGLALRDSGDWKQALDTWLAARDSLAGLGVSDPRIGVAFIELVTEKQATDYYAEATGMYFWGFSHIYPDHFGEVYRQELARLAPLLTQEERSAFRKALKRNDVFAQQLKGFWVRRDPIPTTAMNERLIEHWERIAYVRKKFTVDSTTVYGTDDRGLVFVKYGAPEKIYRGKLGTDQMEIMRWFDEFLLRQEFQRYNPVPQCEIWVYRSLGRTPTTVFIFGRKGGFARYGLRNGIEEFIPERAFSRINTQTTRGVLPGAVIQLMYYSELLMVDPLFRDRYRELEALWSNARAGGRLAPDYQFYLGLLASYRSRDRDRSKFKYLPMDRSDAFEGLERLQLKYKTMRFLDGQGRPQLCFVIASASAGDELAATPFFERSARTKIKFRHVLMRYDREWARQEPIISYPDVENSRTSVIRLPHEDGATQYALVAEKTLMQKRAAKLEVADLPDTANVLGVGSVFVGPIQPLSHDTLAAEMSDVIVGTDTPDYLEHDAYYPFPLIPRDPATAGDHLKMYFELYHLPVSGGAPLKVRLQYKISRVKSNGKMERRVSNKLTFDVHAKRVEKVFPIETEQLAAGRYQLTLEIRVPSSKRKLVRQSSFQIVDD